MALEDYKVEYEDGSTSYFQFDAEDDVQGGAAGLQAMKDAAKNDESPVKSVTKASSVPSVNTPEELAAQAGGASSKK